MEYVDPSEYQNRPNQTRKFLASEKERNEMPLYQAVGLGAVLTTGLLMAGHRSGALRRIANFLEEEAKISYQAFKEIMNEEGSLLKNVSLKRYKDAEQKFKARKQQLKENFKKRTENPLNKREFDIQRVLRQREQLITHEVPYYIEEGLRFQEFMKQIRQRIQNQQLADKIEYALGKGYTGVLKTSKSDVEFYLRNEGIKDREIYNIVHEARNRVNQQRVYIENGEFQAWVQNMQEKLRKMTATEMQKAIKENNKLQQFIIGHRQATVGDILQLHEAGKLKINEELMAQINDILRYNKDFKDAVFDRNVYVRTSNGKVQDVFDYKVFSNINRKHLEWWANTLPGGLLHLRDYLNIRDARENAIFRIMKRGSVQPFLNAHMKFDNKQPLTEEVVFINGKFVKLFDHEAINQNKDLTILNPDRDMYLTSSRYGTISKISRSIAGLMTDDSPRNPVLKALDLGRQSRDADAVELLSVFKKFFNPDWQRNQFARAFQSGVQTTELFYDLKRYFEKYTEGFTPRTFHNIKDLLPEHLKRFIDEENIHFSREEDVLKLFKHLGENYSEQVSYDYLQLYRQFQRNPEEVLSRSTPIGEKNIFIGGNKRIQTGLNRIEQQISLELIRQITRGSDGLVDEHTLLHQLRNRLKEFHHEGKLVENDIKKAEFLVNHYMFQQAGNSIHQSTEQTLRNVSYLFTGDHPTVKVFQDSMRKIIKETNPIWETYSMTKPINRIEDEYIAVNKANVLEKLKSVEGIKDLFLQMGLRTGRRNMEDVTTLTIFGSYYPAYRLQEALGSVGLGFSDESMGSPLQLWSSLMLKRIFPLFAGVAAYQYADYKMDQQTGAGISERWENFKAYEELREAAAREQLGTDLNELKRKRLLKPGIEHFEAMPDLYIPYIGEVGLGQFLNFLTGDAPLDERNIMTTEELYNDILYGTEEIRKGRWWAFGSKSAYRGDRVIQFAPNSYRLAHSDWEYTDVIGSGEEQWTNTLWPTLENWFGLKHLLGQTDLYWFEKKHYYDRPYLLTGQLFNPNTPFIGDIGNAIIGELIKPVRPMHLEYWGDPVLMQEQADSEGERPKEPVVTRVSPSGRIEYKVYASPEAYGGYEVNQEAPTLIPEDELNPKAQQVVEQELAPYEETDTPPKQYILIPRQNAETGEPTGDVIIYDTESEEAIYIPSRMQGEYRTINEAFSAARAAESRSPEDVTIQTSPRDLYAPIYEYQKHVDRQKLMELEDPRNLSWRTQELASNWLEPLGVYNWILMDELVGRDPYSNQIVIQAADDAYNASNAFWDQELGSLGGALSEIGRRFVRRDSGQLEKYNPIQNTMPDWLPGSDYFINFQVGDAMSKIPFGEYRLPGPAYESLNELHPDEFGRYGSFDRFKILADVAPWSDEYKFWRDYVTKYIEDPELRKEIAVIKRQVAKRKKKYEFQEYIFKDAELEKVKVTVRKFLDDYTFLTEEFGDLPIRLAGVDTRPNAEGVLQQYIDVGDKITIGVAADPTQRISDDTYGTMKAVVFKGLESLNRQLIERGEMKENLSDTSAPGIWARFSPAEISKGRRWEALAHHESALNTKFLQVRTALEEYERDQIYGKDFATWENFGITDYLIPSIHRMVGRDSALFALDSAAMSGAAVGWFIGRIFLGGGRNTWYGTGIGALVGLSANLFGKYHEYKTGEKWIPERRRIEHEINEYFDILKYLKFSGLYEKAKEELAKMGFDIEGLFAYIEEKERETKLRRSELEEEKRRLYIEQPKNWEEKRKQINKELERISKEWDEFVLHPAVAQALYYKEQRDSTLYAIDPFEDRMKIISALPYKDKWFFNEFAEANLEEREKILELVPENQRRIYKAIWGYGIEPQKPIEYYARKYNIPGPEWEGWRPDVNLEDVKVKVVQDYDLDLSDFNFWNDDVLNSEYAPDLPSDNFKATPSSFRGYKSVEENIRAIMQGQGLTDVQVIVKPSLSNKTMVNVTYEEDRRKEIEHEFKYNLDFYL